MATNIQTTVWKSAQEKGTLPISCDLFKESVFFSPALVKGSNEYKQASESTIAESAHGVARKRSALSLQLCMTLLGRLMHAIELLHG